MSIPKLQQDLCLSSASLRDYGKDIIKSVGLLPPVYWLLILLSLSYLRGGASIALGNRRLER